MDLKETEWFSTLVVFMTVCLPAIFIVAAFYSIRSGISKMAENEYGKFFTKPDYKHHMINSKCSYQILAEVSWIWIAFAIGSSSMLIMLALLILSK